MWGLWGCGVRIPHFIPHSSHTSPHTFAFRISIPSRSQPSANPVWYAVSVNPRALRPFFRPHNPTAKKVWGIAYPPVCHLSAEAKKIIAQGGSVPARLSLSPARLEFVSSRSDFIQQFSASALSALSAVRSTYMDFGFSI